MSAVKPKTAAELGMLGETITPPAAIDDRKNFWRLSPN